MTANHVTRYLLTSSSHSFCLAVVKTVQRQQSYKMIEINGEKIATQYISNNTLFRILRISHLLFMTYPEIKKK